MPPAPWNDVPPHERVRYLDRFRRAVAEDADRIAATIARETGKSRADAYLTELLPAQLHLRWLARHAPRILAPRRVSAWPQLTKRASLHCIPRGTAGVIAPWNYPFLLALVPTATALAAGCAVVVKPSELTPDSGAELERLAGIAGLPAGTVTTVLGGADAGRSVVDRVDVVAFTGSTEVGREVAQQAARRLIPAILELGGNDAMIVLEDADLERAARTAVWGGFLHAGQSCVSVERVIVVDEVHDRFLDALDRAMRDVEAGSDARRGIGPLTRAIEADAVRRRIEQAVARGATVRHGGTVTGDGDGDGDRPMMAPTVLTGVASDDPILTTETFAPVVAVVRVADEARAIELANRSEHGLSGSVWTRDRQRGRKVAATLEVGSAVVNDAMVTLGMPGAPFGGRGASGLGRSGGEHGLRTFSHELTLVDTWFPLPRELQWFPRRYSARRLRSVVRWLGR